MSDKLRQARKPAARAGWRTAGGRRLRRAGGFCGRRWPAMAAFAAASLLLAACGSATGSGKTGTGASASGHATGGTTVTAWLVTSGPSPANTLVQTTAKKFEASHPGDHITVDFIENTPYKQKIRLAMGAGNPPTIFWTWGGGILDQYIKAGDVQPLGHPSWVSRFLPVTLNNVTYNGNLYGVPIEGTQPVYFFYNKSVLRKAGISSFPATWSGLIQAVHTLKAHGYTPIALADAAGWPGLMYLEYLTDRIGGSGTVKAILDGKPGAWSNPAVVQALTDIQQLVRAGAFQQGYDSLHFGSGGSDALVYSGKAAMQLMGDWDISAILGSDKSFVTSGQLGMAPFPTVAGGTGNPADLEGNTASYVAVASHASAAQKKVAEQFLQELSTMSYAKAAVGAGEVPVIKGAASLFSGQQLASFDKAIYSSVEQAPSFQYSWDQSLGPSEAQTMLTNLEQVFELTETPQKFVSVMNGKGSSG
jgi:raffinose/stachyose/melibiose transport system substrate-binding protein